MDKGLDFLDKVLPKNEQEMFRDNVTTLLFAILLVVGSNTMSSSASKAFAITVIVIILVIKSAFSFLKTKGRR